MVHRVLKFCFCVVLLLFCCLLRLVLKELFTNNCDVPVLDQISVFP